MQCSHVELWASNHILNEMQSNILFCMKRKKDELCAVLICTSNKDPSPSKLASSHNVTRTTQYFECFKETNRHLKRIEELFLAFTF